MTCTAVGDTSVVGWKT